MATYCTITPREGAKHDPHTVPPKVWADPKVPISVKRGMLASWCYLFDGKVKSIFKPADELPTPIPQPWLVPREIPEGEALVAVDYFTPRAPGRDPDETSLVDLHYHEGELEWSAAPASIGITTAPCHLCGKQVPLGEISRHVVACAASGDDEGQPAKALSEMDRTELMAEADRRGVEYRRNSSRDSLLELLGDAADGEEE